MIDLGAVAKGFAIGSAAKELHDFEGFVVNAGGDLYAGGVNERGEPWRNGIRHPAMQYSFIRTVEISNQAICKSGSYERKSAKAAGMHHIFDPISGATGAIVYGLFGGLVYLFVRLLAGNAYHLLTARLSKRKNRNRLPITHRKRSLL